MYDPVKDGVAKTVASVVYTEVPPPSPLAELVHCFWELRTVTELADDFTLHAMPDACVNLLFNQHDTRIAGVTQLHTEHATLDLGRSFHYAGIQSFPGVWRGDPDASVDHYVGEPYTGDLPLVEVSEAAAHVDLAGKAMVFSQFVTTLLDAGLVALVPQADRLHAGPVQQDVRCLTSTIPRPHDPLQWSSKTHGLHSN